MVQKDPENDTENAKETGNTPTNVVPLHWRFDLTKRKLSFHIIAKRTATRQDASQPDKR